MSKFSIDSDINWYGMYFLVPFLVIRIFMEFKGMARDPLASAFWAAMAALVVGPPLYYFFRKQLEIVKVVPLAIYVAIGILVFYMY